jgi:hypothetical protein
MRAISLRGGGLGNQACKYLYILGWRLRQHAMSEVEDEGTARE